MISSLFAYALITFLLTFLGRNLAIRERNSLQLGRTPRFLNPEMILILFFFSLFSGIRYGVGVDYFSYVYLYKNFIDSNFSIWLDSGEYLFHYLTSAFAHAGLHYSFYFGTIALIQIFCIYYLLRKYQYLYLFIPFVLFWNHFYLDWMNGIRQVVAVCIFTFSVEYLIEKKYLKYFLAIIVCSMFHRSSLILLPLVLLPNRDLFKKRWLTVCIVLAAVAIGQTPYINTYYDNIFATAKWIGYANYEYKLTTLAEGAVETHSFGPRNIAFVLNYLFIIYYSDRLKRFHSGDKFFTACYNFTIFNAILFFLFLNVSHIFIRLAMYFENFNLITSAFLLHYLLHVYRRSQGKLGYLIVFLLFALTNMTYLIVQTYLSVDHISYDIIFNH